MLQQAKLGHGAGVESAWLTTPMRFLWLCSLLPAVTQAWMSWRADHPILLPGSEPRRENPIFIPFIHAKQSRSSQLSAASCLLRASVFRNRFADFVLWINQQRGKEATLLKLKPLLPYFIQRNRALAMAAVLLLPFLFSLASGQPLLRLSNIC